MKEGYIPRDQRKKILMLSDDIRTHSGVGNMAREIIVNSAHHFNWANLGGAVKHPDKGKAFDLSSEINKHQTFITAGSLELAKHRADRYSNRWLDDNAYNGVDYIEFKLYDENDEEVHSGEINQVI